MEEGVSSRVIVKGLRTAARLAENKIKEIAVTIDKTDQRDTLLKLASTAMSSKLIKRNSEFFANSKETLVQERMRKWSADSLQWL